MSTAIRISWVKSDNHIEFFFQDSNLYVKSYETSMLNCYKLLAPEKDNAVSFYNDMLIYLREEKWEQGDCTVIFFPQTLRGIANTQNSP